MKAPKTAADSLERGGSATAREWQGPQALQTLPEQIAQRIYAAIVSGDYQPGERIREEELASGFGVSRGPVREALRILERDSVVRVVPNRGAHVTPLSAKELTDIFEIRRVLAGAMVRRLGRPEPALMARMQELVDRLDQLATQPDETKYVAASVDLTLMLAQASGNERLAEIMQSLARQSWRYTQLALSDPKRRQESARNWHAMCQALLRGQSEQAGKAMEKMVDESHQAAIRLLEASAAAAESKREAEVEPAPVPPRRTAATTGRTPRKTVVKTVAKAASKAIAKAR